MRKFYWLLLILLLGVACNSTPIEENPADNPAVAADNEDAPAAVEPPSTVTNDDETVEIETQTIQMVVSDWEMGRYQELADQFSEENPDIRVKFVSVEETLGLGDSWNWPEDADIQLASAADVLAMGVGPDSIARGIVLDLTPFIEADEDITAADFYADGLTTVDGRLPSLPTVVNFNFIFFDKDAFDAAGLDYPEPGWTWTEFAETAAALTIREGDEVVQWGYVSPSFQPFTFLMAQAPTLYTSNDLLNKPQFDTPEVAAAVRWLADLYTVYEATPFFGPEEPDENGVYIPQGYELIDSGQAAMWMEWSGSWSWRQQNVNLGVVPLPVNDPQDKSTPIYLSEGFAISAGTQKPQLAWRWLKFLSLQSPEDGFSAAVAQLPARKSVANATGFWESVDLELGAAMEYALENGYRPQFGPGYEALQEALINVIENGAEVETALADAQVAAMEMYENTLSAQDPENVEQVEITVAESPAEQIANEDAVEITFTAAGSVNGLTPYRDLAKSFMAENPDIIINVREPNYGAGMVDISTMANAADCFQWFPSIPSNLNEVVLNLDPLMDVDPTITAQDFFPHTLEMFRVQGQLVALPSSLRVPLIAYNKDLFDAAGVAYPQNGWTTDDFLETAVALTSGEGDNKQYGFATQAWEFGEFSWFVDLLSGRHFDDSVDPPKLIINNPETVAAVRWFTNLTTEYEVKPTFVTDMNESSSSAYQTRQEMLQNGRIAMWQHDIFNAGFGPSQPELNLGYVTFPIPPDATESAGYQSSIGLFISADTEFRQECWRWITYLTTQHTVDEGLPAREAIARSDSYAAQVGEALASAYLVSMDTATAAPDLSIYGDNEWQGMATVWLLQSYTAIINDGVTVEEALDNGQNKIDSYYGCMVEQANFDDNQTRVDCLQEADDSLPSYYYSVNE